MQNLNNNHNNLEPVRVQANVKIAEISIPSYKSAKKIKVGDRIVGEVLGNTFVKHLHSKTHFLRKPRAICFDLRSLEQAQKFGATEVKIYDMDSRSIYLAPIERIYRKGFYLNRGYGEQIGLTLNFWKLAGPEGLQIGL